MIDDRGERLDRLETTLGHLLRTGVMSAAACLAAGLIVTLIAGSTPLASILLKVGLVILMMTPLMRVVVSLVAYARMRDWFFVSTTLIVFALLLTAWLLKP
jgi:uncharacterized membrane protein